jgi:hypothetical protein
MTDYWTRNPIWAEIKLIVITCGRGGFKAIPAVFYVIKM